MAGLSGSNEAYVGRSYVVGNLLPGHIFKNSSTNFCFDYEALPCSSTFDYLYDDPMYTFNWTPSQSGQFVVGSINVDSYFVAKVQVGLDLYVGYGVPGYGVSYYDKSQTWQFAFDNYEVLTCSPLPSPVVLYDCGKHNAVKLIEKSCNSH